MISPCSELNEDPEARAERLFQRAWELSEQAKVALEAAEDAFQALGRPLPLFEHGTVSEPIK